MTCSTTAGSRSTRPTSPSRACSCKPTTCGCRRCARQAPASSSTENLASALGLDLGGWSWGAQFGDLNNDGTLDVYLVNGYVSAGERTSYWYDFAQIAVGHSQIIGDARNWPAMRGRSLSGYQRKRVWVNDGAGRFVDVAQEVGARDTYDGRAVALADLSNRGTLDVLVANQRGPFLIYRNAVSAGPPLDRVRARRHGQQPQRDRRARRGAVGRPPAGPGSERRQRVQRAKRPAACTTAWAPRARSIACSSAGRRAARR